MRKLIFLVLSIVILLPMPGCENITDISSKLNSSEIASVQVDLPSKVQSEHEKSFEQQAKDMGLSEDQIHTLRNLFYSDNQILSLTPQKIAEIFAPGALLDGGGFDPTTEQQNALAQISIDGRMSLILYNLGYSYEEMLKLSPTEIDFIFPNTELIDNLVAKGYEKEKILNKAALSSNGYQNYKQLIIEAMGKK